MGAFVLVLAAIAAGGFVLWSTTTPDPGSRAAPALESDEQVQVIEDDGYMFRPARPTSVGLIFYPGGRVDPASYAAPARAIAEEGYLVVVPELTLNLAVLDPDAADDVIANHPEIERWVIGGHSLGGAMAADYARDNAESVAGLVLWAAYPAGNTNLRQLDIPVMSVFGTRDGLTTLDDVENSRSRLPTDTTFVPIEGGNHAQFGDYGAQRGDNPATIGPTVQQGQAVEATLQLLQAVD